MRIFFTVGIITAATVLLAACNNQEQNTSQSTTTTVSENDSSGSEGDNSNAAGAAELTGTYSNNNFGFSIRHPAAWQVEEYTGQQGRNITVNIFPPGQAIQSQKPLQVHAAASLSYVAVLPHGLGTELPSGESKSFEQANSSVPLPFHVRKKESRVLYLQNGEPWAYFIVPKEPPSSWRNGFIFAQTGVTDFSLECFDKTTGRTKSEASCDPLTGDKVVRKGIVKKGEADAIKSILASFHFDKTGTASPAAQLIKVEQPKPNSTVSSPLNIKGQARGNWFFEGTFPVVLYNAGNKPLARGIVKAEGKWMTEDFVPFNVTLSFTPPDGEQGKLVFEKANPSGLKENADSLSIPVTFAPKKKT